MSDNAEAMCEVVVSKISEVCVLNKMEVSSEAIDYAGEKKGKSTTARFSKQQKTKAEH